jgi:heme/copper-type cytochrome/quinol oxidase subunit 2
MEGQPILPPGTPSHAQQQWGVIISIVIIVLMIVIGAFYAWGQRISQQNALNAAANATTSEQQSF